jgi:hypothetical protein
MVSAEFVSDGSRGSNTCKMHATAARNENAFKVWDRVDSGQVDKLSVFEMPNKSCPHL